MNSQTSPSFRSAIVAHQAAQAKVDTTDSAQADAWTAALAAEERAHRRVAKTPCKSTEDFLAQISHLVRHERRNVGDTFSFERDRFGQLVRAIELHLGQAVE
jgi:hypothetical protein